MRSPSGVTHSAGVWIEDEEPRCFQAVWESNSRYARERNVGGLSEMKDEARLDSS